MAWFFVAARINSVSLFMFPFRSHMQVFSFEISPAGRLKYPYSFFSYHFTFLVIVVLLGLILSLLLVDVLCKVVFELP